MSPLTKKPLQIRLGSLLLMVAAVAAACTIGMHFGGYTLLMVILFGCAILAHVIGNAMGTRLRDQGTRSADGQSQQRVTVKPLGHEDYAPATKLGKRSTLGWPILIATAVGTVATGGVGGYLVAVVYGSQANLSAILVGTVASAVLGGFWTYLGASFFQVAIAAARQAANHSKPPKT